MSDFGAPLEAIAAAEDKQQLKKLFDGLALAGQAAENFNNALEKVKDNETVLFQFRRLIEIYSQLSAGSTEARNFAPKLNQIFEQIAEGTPPDHAETIEGGIGSLISKMQNKLDGK